MAVAFIRHSRSYSSIGARVEKRRGGPVRHSFIYSEKSRDSDVPAVAVKSRTVACRTERTEVIGRSSKQHHVVDQTKAGKSPAERSRQGAYRNLPGFSAAMPINVS